MRPNVRRALFIGFAIVALIVAALIVRHCVSGPPPQTAGSIYARL